MREERDLHGHTSLLQQSKSSLIIWTQMSDQPRIVQVIKPRLSQACYVLPVCQPACELLYELGSHNEKAWMHSYICHAAPCRPERRTNY